MLQLARRTDAASDLQVGRKLPLLDASGTTIGEVQIAIRTNPNTGALEFRAPLTWTGVRQYRHVDGSVTRELRRPEQVFSPSHLRGLRLLVCTADHPSLEDGTPVYLDARGGPDVVSPDGSALRPASDYQTGHTGDTIERSIVDGYPVPVALVSTTDRKAIGMIAAGRTQTSLGYTALLDDAGGVWEGPHGPEEYDVEHVLDHDDPRVQAAVEAGLLPEVELLVDGEVRKVPAIGPNHFAEAIWRGRGELQSEIVDFVAGPRTAAPRRADAAPAVRPARPVGVIADSAPVATDARVQRAARTARTDEVSAARLPIDLSTFLASAPLSGRYEGAEPCAACGAEAGWNPACAGCSALCTGVEWLGWIEPCAGCPGAGGIAFVAVDGLGLWWGARDVDGGVVGAAVAFAWRGPAPLVAGLPGEASGMCATGRPRLFSMVRQADESGVSGTGHVLDGVVWRDGKCTAAWDTRNAPGSVVVYDSYADFKAIHVDQHPGNGTLLVFDDGGAEPPTVMESIDEQPLVVEPGTVLEFLDAEPLTHEHAARQAPPGRFGEYLRFAFPDGAPSMILARKDSKASWRVQSVRFPADKWSIADAKKWLKSAGLRTDDLRAATAKDSADEEKINTPGTEDSVSFVADEKMTAYAHDVRGDAADARKLTMKIRFPIRFSDAAQAVAQAAKVPAPVKVADATMLEVDLPEGAPDAATIGAVMHAVAASFDRLVGELGTSEAQVANLASQLAEANVEVDSLSAKVDALVLDAEVGKAHRLAAVVALAKKVGLTDADVEGKDADAIRLAAVTKRYPKARGLDSRNVVDGLWSGIETDAAKEPAPALAAPRIDANPAPIVAPRLERSEHVRDSAGDVEGVDKPKPRKLSLHTFG